MSYRQRSGPLLIINCRDETNKIETEHLLPISISNIAYICR